MSASPRWRIDAEKSASGSMPAGYKTRGTEKNDINRMRSTSNPIKEGTAPVFV